MSGTIDEKVKLYKRYFARCHEGEEISEFVSEVVLSTIICEHKKPFRTASMCKKFIWPCSMTVCVSVEKLCFPG